MTIGDSIANLPVATKQSGGHEFFQAVLDKLAKPPLSSTPLVSSTSSTFMESLKKAFIIAVIAGVLVLKPTQAFLDTILTNGYTSVAVQMLIVCILALVVIRK
jgi:hypothetical protein